MKLNSKRELKSWGKSLMIAFGVVFFVRTFLFAPYIVEGASMEPTLHNQEKIFVNKLNFTDSFSRGEIVIIKGKEVNYVKRIIGLPGDTILMRNDNLFINGELVKEPYLLQNLKLAKEIGSQRLTGDFGPITVPKDKYFVMGDNRLKSKDSRNGLGYFTKNQFVGQSEFVVYPFSNIRETE
ncbi:signal peptidase I [Neobacillus rhizophilus]|uniref:Signal peptidase I n=1 Tax=Neobacillus rhizophilus TaxID=2833579 RepID=A0A942U880_9BACI|nr:signal peptidase I [Neobacillus rhizophilus]MBS4214732.1 signal peptidase I [Neobacillus rhizophilus]